MFRFFTVRESGGLVFLGSGFGRLVWIFLMFRWEDVFGSE